MNDIRIGLTIQAINNGYLVTGHKHNGYQSADTGPTFYETFDDLAQSLVENVRQSFDLEFPEFDDNPFGFGQTPMIMN